MTFTMNLKLEGVRVENPRVPVPLEVVWRADDGGGGFARLEPLQEYLRFVLAVVVLEKEGLDVAWDGGVGEAKVSRHVQRFLLVVQVVDEESVVNP